MEGGARWRVGRGRIRRRSRGVLSGGSVGRGVLGGGWGEGGLGGVEGC